MNRKLYIQREKTQEKYLETSSFVKAPYHVPCSSYLIKNVLHLRQASNYTSTGKNQEEGMEWNIITYGHIIILTATINVIVTISLLKVNQPPNPLHFSICQLPFQLVLLPPSIKQWGNVRHQKKIDFYSQILLPEYNKSGTKYPRTIAVWPRLLS